MGRSRKEKQVTLALRTVKAGWAFLKGVSIGPSYAFANIWDWFWDNREGKHPVLLVGMLTVGFLLATGAGVLATVLGMVIGWHFAAQRFRGRACEIEIKW